MGTARLVPGSSVAKIGFRLSDMLAPIIEETIMARPATIHTKSFDERVADLSNTKARQAEFLPPGEERDALERESRQIRIASQLNLWLSSPGLRTPS